MEIAAYLGQEMRIGKSAEAVPKTFSKLSGRFDPFVLQITQVHVNGVSRFSGGEQSIAHAFRLQRRVRDVRRISSPKTPILPVRPVRLPIIANALIEDGLSRIADRNAIVVLPKIRSEAQPYS
jgi:hypothetical protein